MDTLKDKFIGALMGTFVGDALGMAVEGWTAMDIEDNYGELREMQPARLDKSFTRKIKDLNPDLMVVIAYGHILQEELLKAPRIFAVNLHASLLPKYRGASPINYAIMNGEDKTGVTVIKMDKELDAGDNHI